MTTRSLCTFEVAGQRFGIDTSRVQEVVRVDRLTPVPRAASDIRGLMNLRGLIVLAVDAAQRLAVDTLSEGPDEPGVDRPVAVVLPSVDGPIALLVDEVDEITVVEESLFDASAQHPDDAASALIAGAYRTAGRLTLLVDVDRVLTAAGGTHRG